MDGNGLHWLAFRSNGQRLDASKRTSRVGIEQNLLLLPRCPVLVCHVSRQASSGLLLLLHIAERVKNDIQVKEGKLGRTNILDEQTYRHEDVYWVDGTVHIGEGKVDYASWQV
ncbi:hypothetical protein AAC387_Pa11g2047 [Persea americana]